MRCKQQKQKQTCNCHKQDCDQIPRARCQRYAHISTRSHHTLTWRPRHRRRMMASSRLISPRCTVARDDAHEEVALSAPVSPLKSGVLGPLFREACFVPLHRRLCKYDAICLWRPKTDRMR